jgi:hypothetical protein
MNGRVSKKLRKECYPKDYSKHGSGYTSTFVEKVKSLFSPSGVPKGNYKVKMYQIVCTGMRNHYKQAKKNYMSCKKENRKYTFSIAEG